MLDTETLQYLTDDMKSRLVKFEQTFSSAGWPLIMEWAKASAEEQRDRMLFCSNWEQYVNLQAQWTMFTEFANLEESTYAEFERLASELKEHKDQENLLERELEFE